MIENPMVLSQERADPQMQPYPTKRCYWCGELVESHHVRRYGDLDICVDCDAQFLKDSADSEDFDGFVIANMKDYLLNWWWHSLSEFEKMMLLLKCYDQRACAEADHHKHGLAHDRADYCSEKEDEFLDYLRDKWRHRR